MRNKSCKHWTTKCSCLLLNVSKDRENVKEHINMHQILQSFPDWEMLCVKKSFINCEWNIFIVCHLQSSCNFVKLYKKNCANIIKLCIFIWNRILDIKLPWKDKREFYFKMLKCHFYHCQNIIKHNTLFEMCWKWSWLSGKLKNAFDA